MIHVANNDTLKPICSYEHDKVLIDSHQGIGDLAMILPGAKALKEAFPETQIFFIVKSRVESDVVSATGLSSGFFYYDPLMRHTVLEYARLISEIRRLNFDIGVSHIGINPTLAAALLKACGCKLTVGMKSDTARVRFDLPVQIDNSQLRSRRNYELFRALGIKVQDRHLSVFDEMPTSSYIEDLVSSVRGKRIVGLCVGSGSTAFRMGRKRILVDAKQWGIDKWLTLAERVIAKGNSVVLLGGPKEAMQYGSDIDGHMPKNDLLNLVGKCDIVESLNALSHCDAVVGADTGLMFCAALMGKRTYTLLGPSDEIIALPDGKDAHGISLGLDCSPCYGTRRMLECTKRSCLEGLSVDKVVSVLGATDIKENYET